MDKSKLELLLNRDALSLIDIIISGLISLVVIVEILRLLFS